MAFFDAVTTRDIHSDIKFELFDWFWSVKSFFFFHFKISIFLKINYRCRSSTKVDHCALQWDKFFFLKDNYKSLSLRGCAKYDEIDIGINKQRVAACSLKTCNTQMNKNVNMFSELILLHFYGHVGLVWHIKGRNHGIFFCWDKNYVLGIIIIAPFII